MELLTATLLLQSPHHREHRKPQDCQKKGQVFRVLTETKRCWSARELSQAPWANLVQLKLKPQRAASSLLQSSRLSDILRPKWQPEESIIIPCHEKLMVILGQVILSKCSVVEGVKFVHFLARLVRTRNCKQICQKLKQSWLLHLIFQSLKALKNSWALEKHINWKRDQLEA